MTLPRRAPERVLRFPTAVKRDPAIDAWMREHSDELGAIVQRWFEVMRTCGEDVRDSFAAPRLRIRIGCSKAPANSCATSSSRPGARRIRWP